jgi:hypothetical protein
MRRLFAAFVWLLVLSAPLGGAEQVAEYQVKAEFIERFTRFVDWPATASSSKPFVIGVYGEDRFGAYLRELAAARKFKGRDAVVLAVAEAESIDDCDVLFIGSASKRELSNLLEKTRGRAILTIADSEGFAEQGVLINFYSSGNQIRFEINEKAAERSGLRISSKLFKLARVVGGKER